MEQRLADFGVLRTFEIIKAPAKVAEVLRPQLDAQRPSPDVFSSFYVHELIQSLYEDFGTDDEIEEDEEEEREAAPRITAEFAAQEIPTHVPLSCRLPPLATIIHQS